PAAWSAAAWPPPHSTGSGARARLRGDAAARPAGKRVRVLRLHPGAAGLLIEVVPRTLVIGLVARGRFPPRVHRVGDRFADLVRGHDRLHVQDGLAGERATRAVVVREDGVDGRLSVV